MSSLGNIKNILSNFDKGQLVGIDIGISSVKVALLSKGKKNQFVLEGFAVEPLGEAVIIEDEIQKPDEVLNALESALEAAQIKKKIICLGMDGPNTMTKRLKIPDGSKDELRDNVEWEAEQYITFGIDESVLDFNILSKDKDEDVADVFLAAVAESTVESYLELLKSINLAPRVVDLNVIALSNLFEKINHQSIEDISDEGAVIVDFGAQKTTVIVYRNSAPVLTKEIYIGGVLVTEEIQKGMGVNFTDAESLKVSGDEKGNIPEDILPIIESHNQRLSEELKKTLNFYIAAGSSDQVGHCFVTGGSSLLPGTIDMLTDLVHLPVQPLNPFDIITVRKKYSEEEIEQIASMGLVAIGLGLRAV